MPMDKNYICAHQTQVWDDLVVVVPTFRRNRELTVLVKSIATQTLLPAAVIVVDNSNDNTALQVILNLREELSLNINYLPLGENYGPAGSYAKASSWISQNTINARYMLCNDDDNNWPTPLLLSSYRQFFVSVQHLQPAGVGLTGGLYNRKLGRSERLAYRSPEGAAEVDYIPGDGRPIYDLSQFRACGVDFDPLLFFGFEELELGLQLKSAGCVLLVDRRSDYEYKQEKGVLSTASHLSIPGRKQSPWRSYFAVRNSIIVARRYARQLAIMRLILRALWRAILGLVRDGSLRDASAVIAGLVDGVGVVRAPRRPYVQR